MEENTLNVDIAKFKSLFPNRLNVELGNDFFIAKFNITKEDHIIEYPCRVDGFVAIFCNKGELKVDVNLNSIKLTKNTLLLSVPGNILRLSCEENIDEIELYIVAASKEYFSSINLDFNKLFNENMPLLSNPCITIDEEDVQLLDQYVNLGSTLALSTYKYNKDIVGSIISSIIYLFSSLWEKHIETSQLEQERHTTRVNAIFDKFLKLVTEYHTKERGVAFYADKLFLTPKYLSKLIKQVSGNTAPEWINSFVILEAKNMLKYSDLTISEIVYKLNFKNQSVFYKFFKCHTGMTPSEYRQMK